MTIDLPPGRELDKLVAEQFLRWTSVRIPWHRDGIPEGSSAYSVMWYDERGVIVTPPPIAVPVGASNLPQFSADIAHAWIVVHKMIDRWPDFSMSHGWRPTDGKPGPMSNEPGWGVSWGFDGYGWRWQTSDSLPHAICLAALASLDRGDDLVAQV